MPSEVSPDDRESSSSNARSGRGSRHKDSTNPVRSEAKYRVGEARWPGAGDEVLKQRRPQGEVDSKAPAGETLFSFEIRLVA